jgi:hypothetical protein
MAVRFKYILNVKYRGLVPKMRSRIMSSCTYAESIWSPTVQLRAKEVIGKVFGKIVFLNKFSELTERLYVHVLFMQHKFRNRFIYKSAKLEMMESYWDLRLLDMKTKAELKKNYSMIKLCKNIEEEILPEIKSYVLLKFLEQVQKLSWICFYNNRKVERPGICDEAEINLLTWNIH